jgi:hypothetical protein
VVFGEQMVEKKYNHKDHVCRKTLFDMLAKLGIKSSPSFLTTELEHSLDALRYALSNHIEKTHSLIVDVQTFKDHIEDGW